MPYISPGIRAWISRGSLSGFAVSTIRTSLVSELAAEITTKRPLLVRPTETENCRSFSS